MCPTPPPPQHALTGIHVCIYRPRMTKSILFTMRMTPAERRALSRYAKLRKMAVSTLIRTQLIEAALRENPRQVQLTLEPSKGHHASAAR